MKCPKCGIETGEEDKFCGECGKALVEIDIKIDRIEEQGRLLMLGTAWNEGAKLIGGLEKGDIILACNLVSWTLDSVDYYIYENREALKRGVIIKRLYADTIKNIILAQEQKKWGNGEEWEQNFKQILYDSRQPMIDHIIAIDKNNTPKWAVVWIYSPNHPSTKIPGFIIKDRNILNGLHKDFNTKWEDHNLAWAVPNLIINAKVVAVEGKKGRHIYVCEAGGAKIGKTNPTDIEAREEDIIAVAADKIIRIDGGFNWQDPEVICIRREEDKIEPYSAEMLDELSILNDPK